MTRLESVDPRYRSAVNWTSVTDDVELVEHLISEWYRYGVLRVKMITHYKSDDVADGSINTITSWNGNYSSKTWHTDGQLSARSS